MKIIFLQGEIFEFPSFFICLKIHFNVNGKALSHVKTSVVWECWFLMYPQIWTYVFFSIYLPGIMYKVLDICKKYPWYFIYP